MAATNGHKQVKEFLATRRRLEQLGEEAPDESVEDELKRVARSSAVLFRKKVVIMASKPEVQRPTSSARAGSPRARAARTPT